MKRNVVVNIKSDICTGCCVCENSCPCSAITMEENIEGFIHPVVDMKKCTDCGICVEKCPVTAPQYNNDKNPECRAMWANDEIRMTASSGGVFSAFAEFLIKKGGIVCGAAYKEDFSVEHVLIDKIEDLPKLKSSKYMQSNAGLIYRNVKKYLTEGREVLFSGCPCQVAGLYSYLGTTQVENLYTMDIICHGVPSPKVFRKYIRENFSDKHIKHVDFRAKDYYGWSTEMTINFSNGEIFRETHDKNIFYRAFLPCLSLRKSCSNCKFSCLPRQGDITIGDFWGIDRFSKKLNDRKGTSLVLINNQKGKQIINDCENLWGINEIVPIEEGLVINKTIIHPFRAHPARNRFFKNLDKVELSKLVNDCLTHHYDIGIVGLWYGLNYGSILTYYALYEVIRSMGYDPIFLAKPNKLWNERYANRDTIAGRFIYPRCNVSNPRKHDCEWIQMNNHCDAFIVGADVVWNYEICGKEAGYYFFFDFVNESKKKIAYSSSFGSGYHAPEEIRRKTEYYLKRFDHIAVREDEAVKICKEKFGVDAKQVLDPVFLLPASFYEKIITDSGIKDDNKYITTYLLGADERKRAFVEQIASQMGVSYRNFVNLNAPEKGRKNLGLPVIEDASVEKWLFYINNCEFFIGDSFHGLCFALIFRKQFVCFVNRNEPSKVRFISLLSICGLENRLVYTDEDYADKIPELLKPINYDEVYQKLDIYISTSRQWLQNTLDNKKEVKYTEHDLIEEQQKEIMELRKEMEELKIFATSFQKENVEDITKKYIKSLPKKAVNKVKRKCKTILKKN